MSGVYIHVPFCAKRCTYCDFHFSTTFSGYREKMLRSLQTEILQRNKELNSPLKSIYFGGGTPSILTEEDNTTFYDDDLDEFYDGELKTMSKDITEGVSRGRASDLSEKALIEREITKKRAHIPFRQLMKRAGRALRDIKPCYMLSPISTSQIVSPEPEIFDVLIIDEPP